MTVTAARWTAAMHAQQALQQGREQVEAQRVLGVRSGPRRVFVDFHEHAVHAGRDAGACHGLDVRRPGRRCGHRPAPGNCRLCVTS